MEEKKLDHHFDRSPKILHVTAASDYNTKDSNGTIKVIVDKFRQRKNTDKDIWLFGIDISVKNATNNMYA